MLPIKFTSSRLSELNYQMLDFNSAILLCTHPIIWPKGYKGKQEFMVIPYHNRKYFVLFLFLHFFHVNISFFSSSTTDIIVLVCYASLLVYLGEDCFTGTQQVSEAKETKPYLHLVKCYFPPSFNIQKCQPMPLNVIVDK